MGQFEELLAAPDSVAKNESERAKYYRRKEHELSREKRLNSLKSKEQPTVEDILADIIRVAEDEYLNPLGHEFRSISAKRYQTYGYYSFSYIDTLFGQFNHALEVAGLRQTPADRLKRANRAKQSRNEHAQRYFERYVMPYVGKSSDYCDLDAPFRMPSISDTHSQFLDIFVWVSFLRYIKDTQPDVVLFNGDTIEGAEISRHPTIKGWTEPLQSELNFKKEMFRQVREIAGHQGEIFDVNGNHDPGDRLSVYLSQIAPALSSLDCLRLDLLLGLKEFDVTLFQGGTMLSPEGTEDDKPGFLLFDFYRVHHGTCLGQSPALTELKNAGRSGQSGHVHRASLAYGTNERDEALSWMSTPAGCRHEAARSYMKGTTTGWQRGFGDCVLFPDGSVWQQPAVVQGNPEKIHINGFVYERGEDLLDPPTHGNWLKDMESIIKRAV
jgi:hypothetical protein